MTKQPGKPIGPLGWLVRTIVAIALGALLYWLDQEKLVDVGRLADVVTVLVPAIAVYTLFDDRLLEFIVRTIRIVVERVRSEVSRRAAQRDHRASNTQGEAAVDSPLAMAHASIDQQANTENSTFEWPKPRWHHWLIVYLIPVFLVLAVFVFGERLWTTVLKPLLVPEIEGPEAPTPTLADASETPPQSEETEQLRPQRYALVTSGDSCWEIARRCTGSGARFTELGPPLNDLDVDGQCLIQPGQSLQLPENWPKACAN